MNPQIDAKIRYAMMGWAQSLVHVQYITLFNGQKIYVKLHHKAVCIKYMLRGNSVALYDFLGATNYTLQELKRIADGEPQRYAHGSIKQFAVTRQEQVALIRQLCHDMLVLTPQLVAMGATAPEDPMAVIEIWLSMA